MGPGGRRNAALAPPPPVSVTQSGLLTTAAGRQYPPDATPMTNDRTINLVVERMIDEGNNIKYVVFEKGTVWPEGQSGGMEHMQTWKVAYYMEGVRDWLFTQRK